MKKILKCVECSIGCELIVDLTKNEENYFQMNCRHSSQYWKDITALRRSEEGFKLPKLTTEVFNRPDCPDWAKYATVDRDGKARFHAEEPIIPIVYEIDGWYSTSNDSFIPGTFDPSDWENSLIKRPSKEELPDWVKVDNIGWHSEIGYFKVIDVDDIEKKVHIQHMISQIKEHFSFNTVCTEAKYARPRPFNDKEMQSLVGKTIKDKIGNICLISTYLVGGEQIGAFLKFHNAEQLMNSDYTIDGEPCYVLEHKNDKGEWVA